MAFKVSPVAILELAALEEEAAAAAAEAPAFAALVAAVAAGGVTRRIADNIATYDLSSLRGGVSSLRAAVPLQTGRREGSTSTTKELHAENTTHATPDPGEAATKIH